MGNLLSERLSRIAEDIGTPLDDKSVAAFEQEINKFEVNIDDECVKLLAIHRPAASDLRFVISSSRIVNDLESIGDEIARLNQSAAKLIENLNAKEEPSLGDIRQIIVGITELLNEVLASYDNDDLVQATRAILKEREMDEQFLNATRTRITMIMEEPRTVKSTVHGFWMLRSLERIGKCTRQVGNHVLYHLEGHDVRHRSRHHLMEKYLDKDK